LFNSHVSTFQEIFHKETHEFSSIGLGIKVLQQLVYLSADDILLTLVTKIDALV
jgi:hypothetical protein